MPEGNGRVGRTKAPMMVPSAQALLVPPQHFYRTSALPCPYLTEHFERKLITELAGHEAQSLYNILSRAGFRRSHHLAYRPACARCACVPVRIPVGQFTMSRSLRRIRRINADLVARVVEPRASVEQFRLFTRYQRSRHVDSDMASMTFGDFRAMIEESPVASRLVEVVRPRGGTVGACLVDVLDDGLSAVYSFFDPEERRRSLGTLLVLALIDAARERGLGYVYLGYWIAESRKMAYKARFRPLEGFGTDGWRLLTL